MNYDAIQQELGRDQCPELVIRQDPCTNGIYATLVRDEFDYTHGETRATLHDALNSLNQALKEEQGE